MSTAPVTLEVHLIRVLQGVGKGNIHGKLYIMIGITKAGSRQTQEFPVRTKAITKLGLYPLPPSLYSAPNTGFHINKLHTHKVNTGNLFFFFKHVTFSCDKRLVC